MTLEEIEARVAWACAALADQQRRRGLRYADGSIPSEWNLSAALAALLATRFPRHHCDTEVVKRNIRAQRPDIIIHRRGRHAGNLLVIEVKRNGSPGALRRDREKIEEYWFGPLLSYRFGAVVNVQYEGQYIVAHHDVFPNAAPARR